MGGIPNPCNGCGEVACSCCISDTVDIVRDAGTGNPGDCFGMLIATGAVETHLCAEATPSGGLVTGSQVVVCNGGVAQLRNYETACFELNNLGSATGPALAGDEVVVFDGATCVRKFITPSDCAPSAEGDIGDCLPADLAEVWCEGGELKTYPLPQSAVQSGVLAGWTVDLAAATTGVPVVVATSALSALPNPNCTYGFNVVANGNPGHVLYTGDPGAWFEVLIEESVNLGPYMGIHTITCDYRGLSAGVKDSHTLPSWSRVLGVGIGATLFYQWRFTVTLLSAPPAAGVVDNFSSHVTFLGVPSP